MAQVGTRRDCAVGGGSISLISTRSSSMRGQSELAAATMMMTITATITTTIRAVGDDAGDDAREGHAVALLAGLSISRRARRPMTIATGPANEHTSNDAIPRTKATMALLFVGGAAVAYAGVAYGVPGVG